MLTLLTLCAIYGAGRGGAISVWSSGGLAERILSFVQGLPGFYIAALAAIATFNKLDIDKKMPAPAPKIQIQVRGVDQYIELTRRRFLCLMFAFLTAESILLVIISIFGTTMHSSVAAIVPPGAVLYLHVVSAALFFFLFWQMVVITLWGLYYLGDRLHQVDV
ncbi:hypothetical protein EAH83_01880 [Variovorax ginsengisoli]|uniref:Uncharacterized protein n=2 Tax=Variovorax guangxiensis TaxID=1775474 RepID=A0A502E1I9_9BURK|nr:hypothetical protein EAH83_01880 [Variovorax ginsengisoli]TPG30270.1 hypothetical protein EAH82_01880 [Variovorax guangxiensis]